MKRFSLLSAFMAFAMISIAQAPQTEDPAAAYVKVLNERAGKISATLAIGDPAKENKVQEIIVQQYRDLNAIHDGSKEKIKTLKEKAGNSKPDDNSVKEIEDAAVMQLKQLHETYIAKLSTLLNQQQVDKVKDGMTYNVFHVTYTAYQDMIPTLTDSQKNKIYTWLLEAREQAMDQGSSEEKHKVFGKYKGRINNYLSTEGYDLKKEEKGWQERLRKKKETG